MKHAALFGALTVVGLAMSGLSACGSDDASPATSAGGSAAGDASAGSAGHDAGTGGSAGKGGTSGQGGNPNKGGSAGSNAGGAGGTSVGGAGGTSVGGAGGTSVGGAGGTSVGGAGGTSVGGAGGTSVGGAGGTSVGGAGGTSAGGTAGTGGGTPITPDDPGPSDVQLTVNALTDVRPISRYIYGTNQPDWAGAGKNLTLARYGGNRLTAYNWETNASNAGSDWYFHNDAYLGGGSTPGEATRAVVADAHQANASAIVTVPIQGYVAADTLGTDVTQTPNWMSTRFVKSYPSKGQPFADPPSTSDQSVYQDEFVWWLGQHFPAAASDPLRTIFFMLDNEPDLWSATHQEVHPNPVTYAEIVSLSVAYAKAIKAVNPNAVVMAPVNYGWQGFVDLQSAPDANGRDFLEFFLDEMYLAEQANNKRLIDVLDVHWYSEAQGNGVRIVGDDTTAAVVEARIQAPRSLWDTTYTEASWITQWSTNGPINLLPRLQKKIADHYPGTKLSVSEHNHGGGGHISGGMALADVIGVFAREGLFAANMWDMGASSAFCYGGFAMFRNYDGQNGSFGDTSVHAATSNQAASSVFASIDAGSPNRVVIVAINKSSSAQNAGIQVTNTTALTKARVYQLTTTTPTPVPAADIAITKTNAFLYSMPAMSVSTLVIEP